MHLIINVIFFLAGLKWGKWREWRMFYPTILFFILCDLFSNVITYQHPLWRYQETIFATNIFSNHTIISFMIMLIVYPVTILIYLGHFPKRTGKKILWIFLWVALYWTVEYINLHYLKLIRHENGWTMGWSFAFNIVMFTTLWVHYKKPVVAWVLSLIWSVIIITFFNIHIGSLP